MKKFKKIAYVLLIAVIIILSLTIYTNASKDNGENQKEKVLAEIKYLEIKLENLFNGMNNIKINDYNIVEIETSKAANNNTNQEEGRKQSEGESGEQSDSQEKSEGGEQSSSGEKSEESGSSKDNKKFEIEKNQILTSGEQEINWTSIKNEIENLYGDLASITMDMYQIDNINQEDILNFNKECDNLTNVVQKEEKEGTLTQLTKVYDYLPKFLKSSEQDELYTTIVESKSNIFKAYSKIDGENWGEILNDIKRAIEVYSKLLTNTNIPQQKQSNISKGYVMISEIQNAINLKDKSIFLIKYKNALEEMNNM